MINEGGENGKSLFSILPAARLSRHFGSDNVPNAGKHTNTRSVVVGKHLIFKFSQKLPSI